MALSDMLDSIGETGQPSSMGRVSARWTSTRIMDIPPSPHTLIRKSAGPCAFAKYKAYVSGTRWELAISGRWSESPYHSGHIAYYVRRIAGGVWLMKSVERNADLDDITEEDIEEGALNDDQLQALWGRTLEEAQNEEFVEIVAAWLDAPRKTFSNDFDSTPALATEPR